MTIKGREDTKLNFSALASDPETDLGFIAEVCSAPLVCLLDLTVTDLF